MRNHFEGLESFLARWSAGPPGGHRAQARIAVGPLGHINLQGDATCSSAAALTRWDSGFDEALEPGIRALVYVLVDRLNVITYSSCEGHCGDGARPPDYRHVAILPRDEREEKQVSARLKAAVRTAGKIAPSSAKATVKRKLLTTDFSVHKCLELLIEPAPGIDERRYFAAAEEVTGHIIMTLTEGAEAPDESADVNELAGETSALQRAMTLLSARGAASARHSSASLEAHLRGTASILRAWGAPPETILAGLCHAIYGTESYETALVEREERDCLRAAVGNQAERLSYVFGMRSGRSFVEATDAASIKRFRATLTPEMLADGDNYALENRLTGEPMLVTFEELQNLAEIAVANAVQQAPRADALALEEAHSIARYWALVSPAAQRAMEKCFL